MVSLLPKDSKIILWYKLHQYIQIITLPVIVQMARDEGHEVLYCPLHYSDLQPIELVWAIVKGEVSRLYTTEKYINIRQCLDSLNSGMYPQRKSEYGKSIQSVDDHRKYGGRRRQ